MEGIWVLVISDVVLGDGGVSCEKGVSGWEVIRSVESFDLEMMKLFFIGVNKGSFLFESLPKKGNLLIFLFGDFRILISHKLDKVIFFFQLKFKLINFGVIVVFLLIKFIAISLNLFPQLKVFELLVLELFVESLDRWQFTDEDRVGLFEVLYFVHVTL
jgi:hypothetical protein